MKRHAEINGPMSSLGLDTPDIGRSAYRVLLLLSISGRPADPPCTRPQSRRSPRLYEQIQEDKDDGERA
ncbi:hypothetical protein FJTKL_12441 [Diaporthe vaccinii]|uniref:Uncharacterized protein n=1 Tax=Diaporthe vaccinii TaxID=105482 RepID=A0ABR4EDB0_9PEZI